MSFYEALQLSAEQMKPLIKKEEDKKIKQKYILALISKSVLCTLFCIIFVSTFVNLFGIENSMVGVVSVIAVLAFRFTNLDFNIKQSTVTIFGFFIIYAICPYLANRANPMMGFIINFISILTIVVLSCHNMQMQNHTILVLLYMLLYGNGVTSMESYINRVIGLLVGGAIVGTIFYIKNKKRKLEFENNILDIIKDFDVKEERGKWQLKLTLGISIGVLIGEILHLPRTMWIAFACMSVIQPSKESLNIRYKKRMLFIIIGCISFMVVHAILPEQIRTMLPLMAGVLVGLCATYEWKLIINCFSALPSAVASLGLWNAVIFRMINNVFGALYSKLFDHLFDKSIEKLSKRKEIDNLQMNA